MVLKYKIFIVPRRLFEFFPIIFLMVLQTQQVNAELSYRATLPQFGGFNTQAMSTLQYERQLRSSKDAKVAAAIRAENTPTKIIPTTSHTDRLVTSIVNYLNVGIAQQFANQILNGTAQSGTFIIGGTTIGFVRSDGLLSLEIGDASGTTNIQLPVAN